MIYQPAAFLFSILQLPAKPSQNMSYQPIQFSSYSALPQPAASLLSLSLFLAFLFTINTLLSTPSLILFLCLGVVKQKKSEQKFFTLFFSKNYNHWYKFLQTEK